MKRLIVNADDFGQAHIINLGITHAHKLGIVTSTSLMVNMPHCFRAVELLKTIPSLAAGLHLNLTFGPPVSSPYEVRSIVNGKGSFNGIEGLSIPTARKNEKIQDLMTAILRNFASLADERDVEREVSAQFNKFVRLMGNLPTHIDTHHHIHKLPIVLRHVMALSRDNSIPVRQIDPQMREILLQSSIRTTDQFVDTLTDKQNGAKLMRYLKNVLSCLEDGVTEMLCHPGFSNNRLRKQTLYADQRKTELECLCNPGLKKCISEKKIDLITYKEL